MDKNISIGLPDLTWENKGEMFASDYVPIYPMGLLSETPLVMKG